MEGKPPPNRAHESSVQWVELPSAEYDPCGEATHQVLNQARPFSGYNAFQDLALQEGVARHGGRWGYGVLQHLGAKVGSEEPGSLRRFAAREKALEANRQVPRLELFDRFGVRINGVSFHPAYHELMELGSLGEAVRVPSEAEAAAFAWQHPARSGAHVIRGALMYLMYQLDQGVCCPITMTFAAVPALASSASGGHESSFVKSFLEKLVSGHYDAKDIPFASKAGATCGMSMTEKQGGSDVRSNTTQAKPVVPGKESSGDAFWLVGHKWFTSAPMSDAFLTLAQSREGVSCFLVPRWRPDGRRNGGFLVQRLKEKVGDKSNASSEVEYRHAWGVMIGQPGRGVRTIVEMVVHTRLDCIIGSSALMRLSAQMAAHHASERWAFGKPLIQQASMRQVLVDLALESEAALCTWLRLARALDEGEALLARIATAVGKYYVCKRAPLVAYEAMECHGGNGYVEEHPMARLYRQAPLNAIWEGSGNVICLDILRALQKEPATADALLDELRRAKEFALELDKEIPNSYNKTLEEVEEQLDSGDAELELGAREFAEKLAVCFQASSLLQFGDPLVARGFLATRLPKAPTLSTHCLGSSTSRLPESITDHLLQRLHMELHIPSRL
eukprot:g2326.t1